MVATGFQAMVLCGPGASLNPLNSNPTDFPKALIPIANRPMVWYALEWCYRMGVNTIHLVTPPESRAPLEAALSQNPHLTSLPSPRPSILAPDELDLTTGSAEIFKLQEVQNVITTDFIILPCDIICELNGLYLLEAWTLLNGELFSQNSRNSRSTPSHERGGRIGGLGVWYQTKDSAEDGIGVRKEETDCIALTNLVTSTVSNMSLRPYTYNLVISMPKTAIQDDMEDNRSFSIRHALLRNHGKIKLYMSHRDAHIYFLPLWAKELMRRNDSFESVSEDLIGSWAKAVWQYGLAEKLGFRDLFDCTQSSRSEKHERLGEIDIENLSTSSSKNSGPVARTQHHNDRQNFASPVRDAASPGSEYHQKLVPPIFCYTHPPQPAASLLRRIDTVPLLLSASLAIAKLPCITELGSNTKPSPFAHVHKISPATMIPPQISIHQASVLIDANVTLTPKSTIKESVIGSNCVLGTQGATEGAIRLNRCLLMEGVVIESKNVLNGCVLGRRCKIETGCDLRDCSVQENYIVTSGTVAKGEVFASFDEGGDFQGDVESSEGAVAEDNIEGSQIQDPS